MDMDTIAAAFGCSMARARDSHDGINAALVAAGCTTVRRCAMYAAQVGHETLSLIYDGEVWGPTTQQKRYDPASGTKLSRDLGNTAVGDGYQYRGRGRIQLTGKVNYLAFGRWCHARGLVPAADHFVRNPDLVAQAPWRDLAASWYWTVARPGINPAADRGDVREVTRLINGGTNGLADRQHRYDGAVKLGDRLLPTSTGGADMPLTQDDLIKIRDIVWQAPIPDFYTANPADQMPAYVTLGWAAAHPAIARDRAVEARDAARSSGSSVLAEVAALRTALAAATAGSAKPLSADDVRKLVADAVAAVGPLYLTADHPQP